jgi:hypothetical protein
MSLPEALRDLRAVFSPTLPEELQSYASSMPTLLKVNPTGSAGPASFHSWASAMGPVTTFPFYTPVAAVIWKAAKKIIKKNPLTNPLEVLRMAMLDSKMSDQEITPEDFKLLELAISWAQNGPAQPTPPVANVDRPFQASASYGSGI